MAQASALMLETRQGYPLHAWLAMGHLAEASDELVEQFPEQADMIREHRKIYEDNQGYNVPIMEILAELSRLADEIDAAEEERKAKRRRNRG